MSDGAVADKWVSDLDHDVGASTPTVKVVPQQEYDSDEFRQFSVAVKTLQGVIRRFCELRPTFVLELKSSGTQLIDDSYLDNEDNDDPVVGISNHNWVVGSDERRREEREKKLIDFTHYLERTPAPDLDGEPYLSTVRAEQSRNLLAFLVSMGMEPEVAPDSEGGISIRWESGGRVGILSIDNERIRLMLNPLDNDRRIIKTIENV